MNIYSDKSVYIIIAIILAVVAIPATLLAYRIEGIKTSIFCLWIIFGSYLTLIIAARSLKKTPQTKSRKIHTQIISGLFHYDVYQIYLGSIAFLFFLLSAIVWGFLDSWFSTPEALPTSEIPIVRYR